MLNTSAVVLKPASFFDIGCVADVKTETALASISWLVSFEPEIR